MKTTTKREAETKIDTEWRRLNKSGPERIRASFGFHYIPGNSHPYFSITAKTAEPYHGLASAGYGDVVSIPVPDGYDPQDWPKKWKLCSFGCLHDSIAKAFPELSELIRWHLASDNAEPMHYLENARYWLQKHFGVFRVFKHSEPEGRKDGEPEPLDAFKSVIAFGSVANDSQRLKHLLETEAEPRELPDLAKTPAELLAERVIPAALLWLENRASTMRAAMRDVMERHGIEYIEIEN